MNVTPKTKRQALGELIAFERSDMPMSQHNLGTKTRATIKMIDRWERGDLVPTAEEWSRLRSVFPRLAAGNRYRELFEAAAAEQRAIEEAKDGQPTPPRKPELTGASVDLDAAVRMIVDAVPALRSLSIEVDEDGSVSVNWQTREVKIVEDSGSMRVRTR